MKKYFPLTQYSMKFRLYPNKTQQRMIDNIIHCLHVYHNNVVYDMKTNLLYTIEKEDEKNPSLTVHWPDWNHADGFKNGMKEAAFYKKYIEADERLKCIPASSFSNSSRSIINDMIKAWEDTGKCPIERWEQTKKDEDGNKINIGVSYYTKSKPRKSFPTQIKCSAFSRAAYNELDKDGNIQYKNNVMFITIPKVGGKVKARGWNKKIKFDENHEIDFLTFCEKNPEKNLSCSISKDKTEGYFISVSVINKATRGKSVADIKPVCWKDADVPDIKKESDGVDVGEITIATLSDGTKYENVSDHNHRIKILRKKIDYYNQKLSKMWGYSNEEFRNEMKRIKTKNTWIEKKNEDLPEDQKVSLLPLPKPSNQYLKMEKKRNQANRDIINIRKDWYHKVSKTIVTSTELLGIEGLKVKDMQQNKDVNPDKTNKQIHKHNKNLSEAAIYDLLSMIKYKTGWYGTILEVLNQYEASTCVCSSCGAKVDKIDTKIRKWTCPYCCTLHDRDTNAAEVIRQKAIKQHLEKLKQTSIA